MPNVLSPEQLEESHADGLVFVRGLFDAGYGD